ncbi:MAG: lytic transglycosylase domain-containing protein [Wenzhouxiangella sp.]
MKTRFLLALWLPLLGLSIPGLAATSVSVPLTVDWPHLESKVAESLGLGPDGRGRLQSDRCNLTDLSDLELRLVDQRLELSLAVTAYTGFELAGSCRGPAPVSGRLQLEMKPAIDTRASAVIFNPVGAELRRPDGGAGLLSRPSRLLADNLIVPRLAQVRVEVGSLLAALDELVESFMQGADPGIPRLAERGRLAEVGLGREGLRVAVALAVQRPPANLVALEPVPALDDAERLEWQRVEDELDGFLSVLIARMASQADDRALQLDFLALLLDSRQRIAEALDQDEHEADPVRALFIDAWTGLRPLLARLEPANVADDRDLRLAGFIAAGDLLSALDALGPEFGLDISRDGLRQLARLLMADEAPLSFTPLPLTEDADLRRLFGLDPDGPNARPGLPSLPWWERLFPVAYADSIPLAQALRGVVARPAILGDYLQMVAQLLDELYAEHTASSRIPADYQHIFHPLVRATAWRESCWRHYVGPADEPRVIRSSMGAIGMMQIMGRVWRGVYDVNRLEAEIDYNVSAGIEILEHYLVDYAIRRGEHQHPGGIDNLVRATYAAYNGGPSHLSRHRREDTPERLRAIDDSFWEEFTLIRDQGWPPVSRCFSVPD